MVIKTFFSGLIDHFEKGRLMDDIDRQSTFIEEIIIPFYKKTLDAFQGKKIDSKYFKNFDEMFKYKVERFKRYTFLEGILKISEEMHEQLKFLSEISEELFSEEITKETLTFKKVSIVRALCYIDFINQYSVDLLLRFIAAENQMVLGTPEKIDSQLTNGEIKWMNEKEETYLNLLNIFSIPSKEFKKLIENISDITVDEESLNRGHFLVEQSKSDPLKLNLLPPSINPIYGIRMAITDFQHWLYKKKIANAKALEYRLLSLEEARKGKQDVTLQKQIDYYENLLKKYKAEIRDFEESVGL